MVASSVAALSPLARIAPSSTARAKACGVWASQTSLRGMVSATKAPSAAARLMVSRAGTAGTAAPASRAAARTRSMIAAGANGRAASCTSTKSTTGVSCEKPARTESCRSAPPAT